MSDNGTDQTPDHAPDHTDAVRLALDAAHRAAKDLDGGTLRRSLEEASDLLRASCDQPGATAMTRTAADRIGRALADLDAGPLDEAERLIEQVRTDLTPPV